MMAIMRKLIDSKFYKIILWLFLFMMAIGSGIMLNMGNEKKWVIKIYNDMMSSEHFDNFVRLAKQQKELYRQKGIILAGKNVEKEAVINSVSELLRDQALSSLGLVIPQEAVEQKVREELAMLPAYFFDERGALKEDAFARLIAPQKIEEFLKNVEKSIEANTFYALADASLYTPDFESESQLVADLAKKEYSVLKLSGQSFVAKVKETTVSDEMLEKFYKKSKNNEQFRTPERRAGKVWRFSVKDFGISVNEADIKKQYEKNKQDYLVTPSQMQVRVLSIQDQADAPQAAREKIEELYKQAEQNADNFVSMVKDFSDDKVAAKNGGLTKLFAQDTTDIDKAIVTTAFDSLINDGQISNPVKIDGGYALLQRVKKVPAQYKELASVSSEIGEKLLESKFKQRFEQDAQRAINSARYNPELLEKLLKKGQKSEISLTTNKGSIEISRLFKTEEGKYATFFDKNDGIMVLCEEIEKSKIPALHEIKDAVLKKYYEVEGAQLLEDAVERMLQAARSGKDFEVIAKEFGAKLEKAHFEYKNGSAEQSPILRPGAVQTKLKAVTTPGAIMSVVSDNDGLVIRLDSIEALDENSMKDKERIVKTMNYAKKYKVKEGFIASLYRRAKLDNKIEMKQEVLQLLKEA